MKNSILIFATLVFANINVCAQTWQWVREEATSPEAYGVAADNAGNVFLSGITVGTASIGSYTNTSTALGGAIAKYDANGNVLWANFIPNCSGYNVACDAAGNAFLCGYFSTTITIGSQTLVPAGSNDIFVAKYSPTGTVLWAASAGGAGLENSNCVNVDALGNVIVSGYVGTGTFTFGASTISVTAGQRYLVLKFSNSGTPLWAICGGSGQSTSNYVCTDASNDIYLTGSFTSTSSIGSGTYVSNGSSDMYIAKFSAAGLPVWGAVGGGTLNEVGYCVRAHPSGDIFVTGS